MVKIIPEAVVDWSSAGKMLLNAATPDSNTATNRIEFLKIVTN